MLGDITNKNTLLCKLTRYLETSKMRKCTVFTFFGQNVNSLQLSGSPLCELSFTSRTSRCQTRLTYFQENRSTVCFHFDTSNYSIICQSCAPESTLSGVGCNNERYRFNRCHKSVHWDRQLGENRRLSELLENRFGSQVTGS